MKNQTCKGDVICIAFIFGIMFSRKGVLWENKNPSRAWALGWNEIGFNLIAGLGVATPNAKRHAQCSTQRAVCQLFLLDRAKSAARRVPIALSTIKQRDGYDQVLDCTEGRGMSSCYTVGDYGMDYETYTEKYAESFKRVFHDFELPESTIEWLFRPYQNLRVHVVNDSAAYFVDDGYVIHHKEAIKLLKLLLNFYQRATPDDIGLMNMPEPPRPQQSEAKSKKKATRSGYVYLVKEINGPHYKIGRSKNPKNRTETFGVKLPYRVDYECIIKADDMYELEATLHKQFEDKQVDGEWFALEPEDVAYIKSLAGGNNAS